MIPTLDLPIEYLTSPLRLHLAAVENLMLWPDDEAMRSRAMKVAIVEEGQSLSRRGLLSNIEISELLDAAVVTERRADLVDHTVNSLTQGLVTGIVLFRAISHADIEGDRGKIGLSIDIISERIWPKYRLRPKTITNQVLPRFRSVAPLWAAFVAEALKDERSFPCRVTKLPEFFAYAEEYRKKGEATRTPHSPRMLLQPGESVVIPYVDLLPKVHLEFVNSDIPSTLPKHLGKDG